MLYLAITESYLHRKKPLFQNLKLDFRLLTCMTTTLKEFMSRKLESIENAAFLQEAAKLMTIKDVSSLIILDKNNKHVGIVSERDIVRKGCSREDLDIKTIRVSEIMSSPVVTVNVKSTPREAAELLIKNKIRHLLVVDDAGKHVGIITPMDFTRYKQLNYNTSYGEKAEAQDTVAKILEYYVD
jgi:CBS domain-containing protein